ncbi:hypothetical protein SISNIDRAFT_485250 [Sistotremastrum niveocremeum HHB9708]|uniref:WD40 repeat-like protein n=1 Tax=Sistotremastrum niveocremeum HHB9708 TaxID=1314777 RepID=A0A164UXV3_9AGAM|nr:hypothetical protein SISNIDRAFT_485250 [Sistotremastrum niveocremeum HHB9708]
MVDISTKTRSTSLRRADWSARAQVRHQYLSDRAWKNHLFITQPIDFAWRGKRHPILSLSADRLVVAVGSRLMVYSISAAGRDRPTKLTKHCTLDISVSSRSPRNSMALTDVTGLGCVEPGLVGIPDSIVVTQGDGSLREVELPSNIYQPPPDKPCDAVLRTRSPSQSSGSIQSMSSYRSNSLTLSSTGMAYLYGGSIFDTSPSTVQISRAKGWSTHLTSSWAALGTSSPTPLTICSVTPSGLSSHPIAGLHRSVDHLALPAQASASPSAVYGITSPPIGFPAGSPDQIVVSAWFDGKVRLHDLRDGSPKPSLVMKDPWTATDAKYCVSVGGGASAQVVAGSSFHSVVCVWDVRSPDKSGWSLHAPGNDRSPVYSLILEGSRMWCATESRVCVFDFDPDAIVGLYPSGLPRLSSNAQHREGYNSQASLYNHLF